MPYEYHICVECRKRFSNIDKLNRHMATHSITSEKVCSVISIVVWLVHRCLSNHYIKY